MTSVTSFCDLIDEVTCISVRSGRCGLMLIVSHALVLHFLMVRDALVVS